MKLLALIIALLINGQLSAGGWRSARGFNRYADWLRQRLMPMRLWNHAGGLALLLVPFVVLLGVLQLLIGHWLFGAVGLALGVVALCFAFGGGEPLETEVASFTAAWRRGDEAEAQSALNALAGTAIAPVAMEQMPEVAATHLLRRGRTRLFAPIFWFVLLGPVGAVGYRLVVLARAFGDCQDNAGPGYCQRAEQLVALLDWVPDRLMAAALALGGHFSAAAQGWEQSAGTADNDRLSQAGLGALGLPPADEAVTRDLTAEAVDDAHALLRRALYIWLAALAAGVLLGAL